MSKLRFDLCPLKRKHSLLDQTIAQFFLMQTVNRRLKFPNCIAKHLSKYEFVGHCLDFKGNFENGHFPKPESTEYRLRHFYLNCPCRLPVCLNAWTLSHGAWLILREITQSVTSDSYRTSFF